MTARKGHSNVYTLASREKPCGWWVSPFGPARAVGGKGSVLPRVGSPISRSGVFVKLIAVRSAVVSTNPRAAWCTNGMAKTVGSVQRREVLRPSE